MKLSIFTLALLLLSIVLLGYNNFFNRAINKNLPIAGCDTATFHFSNAQNDTSKVIYLSGVVFDTTACMLNVEVVDNITMRPIEKAQVAFDVGENNFSKNTDKKGEVNFFSELICGPNETYIFITTPGYNCTKIKYSQYAGGLCMKVKLRKKLA